MGLLLDANVSFRLIPKLEPVFGKCYHVDLVGLDVPASDKEIWQYALNQKLLIVTNDEDFIDLVHQNSFPPKVILLRTGNQSNQFIEKILIDNFERISNFEKNEEFGILEII